MLVIMAFCFKSLNKRYIFRLKECELKGISKIIDYGDKNFSSVKPQQIFNLFLNQNILFQECPKTNQTYISDILTLFECMLRIKINKNKWENDDNLILFWNRPNFIRNEIIIHILLIKAISFTSYSPEGTSLSLRSMNMRALVKVLILMTRIFLSLALQNYHSLNVSNFRRF